MKRKEIIKCKHLFTIKGVSKTSKNTYIIPVIETNGENHKKELMNVNNILQLYGFTRVKRISIFYLLK